MNIFKDLYIIELANVLAGPSVGMFFAELGAKVLKVENKITNGDVTRTWKLKSENQESNLSAYFASVNYGKKFIQLDLNKSDNRKILYAEIRKADILISSYKMGDDKKLKVDYASLKKINSKLIYGHITGYGKMNPKAGYDAVIQAESGFMFMNGDANSKPTKLPVALIDILSAHQLKEGLLCALINRMKNKHGSYVHVSLIESAIASLANQATNYLLANHIPQRIGSEHPNIVPYGTAFRTKDDKYIVLAIGTNKQFYEFCKIISNSNLAENESYKTNQKRVQNREYLNSILEKEILSWKQVELIRKCHATLIPCAAINNMKDLFQLDVAKNMIIEKDGIKSVKSVVFEINSP